MDSFQKKAQLSIFDLVSDGENPSGALICMETAYLDLFKDFKTSEDNPSRVCAIFIKEVKSYM